MDGISRCCASCAKSRLPHEVVAGSELPSHRDTSVKAAASAHRQIVGMLVAASTGLAGPWAMAFDAGRAGFSIRVNDETIPYEVFAVYALPEEILDVEVLGSDGSRYEIAAHGSVEGQGEGRWRVRTPEQPGLYEAIIAGPSGSLALNVFVMHPASAVKGGWLGEYRVGAYPETPLGGDPVYLPPDGFIELDERTASVRVSPHFTLSQFPAKQAGGYPKFLVLRERLLLKLELLLEQLNAEGIRADTLTIMSGYRTPFYNEAIGNVPYSRHVYGGAADVFLDEDPRDGVMDDLNGDGRLDFRDAQALYRIANRLFSRPQHRVLLGGQGVYRRTSAHGPFLHIDARGFRSRWGLIP